MDKTTVGLIFCHIGNLISSLIAGATIGKYANSLTEFIIYFIVSVALIITFWMKLADWWYKRQSRMQG